MVRARDRERRRRLWIQIQTRSKLCKPRAFFPLENPRIISPLLPTIDAGPK